MAKNLRCYMCSDLHAANRTYRKLLNSIKMNVYEAQVVFIVGDLTGKAIVPIIAQGNGRYYATFLDQEYHTETEAERQKVNAWIRGSGKFDAVIDFDAAVRDPQHPTRIARQYDSGDFLHPGDAGYRHMAEIIDLNLFSR